MRAEGRTLSVRDQERSRIRAYMLRKRGWGVGVRTNSALPTALPDRRATAHAFDCPPFKEAIDWYDAAPLGISILERGQL